MQAVYMIISDAILQTFFIVICAGGVLGLVFGALLIVDSPRVFRINERMGRWVSMRTWFKPFDVPRSLDLPIYRRNRLVGIALIACAAYTLYMLILRYSAEPFMHAFRGLAQPVVLDWIVQSVHVALVAGNVLLLCIGIILIVRPNLIRALEGWANRHYSTRDLTKPLDAMHGQPDRFVRDHPKLVGWLLVIGSAYVLIILLAVFYL